MAYLYMRKEEEALVTNKPIHVLPSRALVLLLFAAPCKAVVTRVVQ